MTQNIIYKSESGDLQEVNEHAKKIADGHSYTIHYMYGRCFCISVEL